MKNHFIILVVCFCTTSVNSQSNLFDCITPENTSTLNQENYSFSTDPLIYQEADPVVLNIFFWQIKEPDGSYGGAVFSENKLLESVAQLNIEYNPFNIFFKYRGYDSIISPANLPLVNYVWNDVLEIYECIEAVGQVDPDGFGFIGRCQMSGTDTFWQFINSNSEYSHRCIKYIRPLRE
jgi:hypothetical protein